MPPIIAATLAQSEERKSASSPSKIRKDSSGNAQDQRESNITQILSQRLGNMEQQLVLLRGDLKNAVETLRKKDQEITTLENKVALAERRSEAEKNGLPSEDLHDSSEDVDPQSKSKHELLQKECETLAQKLQDMEKFFGDYGLAWVKEDALDEKDPNNLWVRKSNVHYTPDFDKIFVVVEELNLGNAEPQIVKAGNTAQFKTADLLNLSLYADGIQLENNPFRPYESPSVEEFFRDLEDGYFPTELKGKHPEGVIFKVRDMRNTTYADDPNRRPAVRRGQNVIPRRKSTSSVSRGSQISSDGVDVKSVSGTVPNTNAGGTQRRRRLLSQRSSASSRRSIIKNIAKKSTDSSNAADGKMHPQYPTNLATSGNGEKDIKLVPSEVGDIKAARGETGGNFDKLHTSTGGDSKAIESSVGVDGPEGEEAAKTEQTKTKEGETDVMKSDGGVRDTMKSREDVADSSKPCPGSDEVSKKDDADTVWPDPKSTDADLKELYVAGESPQDSSTRVAQSTAKGTHEEQKIPKEEELDKELTKDSFGLPRPPLSISASDRLGDVQKPTGPPSKHFDNYFLNKTGETQTSGTYIIAPAPQGQPQPTHITNITYNEGPITIQMTPNELKGVERNTIASTASTALKICPVHHPHPCTCAYGTLSSDSPEEDGIGPVNVIKITGETEYREKYTEGAMNTKNVWQQKKRSQEQEQKRSQGGSVGESSAAPEVAPIPPDPVLMGAAFDPNVQWPNFVYFGHPKGQESSPPPSASVSPQFMAKKKPESPQVIQLNEKTSERMIVVKMRTRSGHKEFNANVYPEEPVKKLWSLLKLNYKEYSLTSTQAPHKPLRKGSLGEHSIDNGISLVLSKTEASSLPMDETTGSVSSASDQGSKSKFGLGVKKSQDEGISYPISKTPGSQKTDKEPSSRDGLNTLDPTSTAKTELKSTSSEGSKVKNTKINIDSHTSYSESEQEKNDGTRKQETTSREKQNTTEEYGRSSLVATQLSSHQPLQQKDPPRSFSIPITPKTRAKALSEHLSQSSLRKKSFQSYRDSPLKETLQKEPSLLENERGTSIGSQRTAGSKGFTRSSPLSFTGRLPDKDASAEKMLKEGSNTSKQSVRSLTKTKPKSLTSTQSLKPPDKKVPSKSPSINKRFSASKLSLEKTDKPTHLPSFSSAGSTDVKIMVHSPTPVSSGKEEWSSIDQPESSGKRNNTEEKRGSRSAAPKKKRSSMGRNGHFGSKEHLSPVPSGKKKLVDREHLEIETTSRKISNGSLRGKFHSIAQPVVDGKRNDAAQRRSSHSTRSVHGPIEKISSMSRKGSFGSKHLSPAVPSGKKKVVDQEHPEVETTDRKSSNGNVREKLYPTDQPVIEDKRNDAAQGRRSHSIRSVHDTIEKTSSMGGKGSFGSKQNLSLVPPGENKMVDHQQLEVEITGRKNSNERVRGKLSSIDQPIVKRNDAAQRRRSHSIRSVHETIEKTSSIGRKGSFGSKQNLSLVPPGENKMVDHQQLEVEITGRKSSNERVRGKLLSSIDQPIVKRNDAAQGRRSHSIRSVHETIEKTSSMGGKGSFGSKQNLSLVPPGENKMVDHQQLEVEITGRKSSNERVRGKLLSSIDQPIVKRNDAAQGRRSHSIRSVHETIEKTSSMGGKGSFGSKQNLSLVPPGENKMVDHQQLEVEITGRKSSNESVRGKLLSSIDQPIVKRNDVAQRRRSHSIRSVHETIEKTSSIGRKGSFGSKQNLSLVPPGENKMVDHQQLEVEITGRKSSNESVRGKLSSIDQPIVKRNDAAQRRSSHSSRSFHGHVEKTSSTGSFSFRKSVSPRREPTIFLERNEVNQSPGDTTAEKYDKGGFHAAGIPSVDQTTTPDAERRSAVREIVKPIDPGKRLSNPNVDGHSLQSGGDSKNANETGSSQGIAESPVKVDIKVPNTDPPHISEGDLRDDEEAKISSVNHEHKFEYDKHDSEQEFNRETPTDTPTVNIDVKNDVQMHSAGRIEEREEKNIVTPKKKTKSSIKNKTRRSSEYDGTKERGDSQESDNSDGNKEENAEVTSTAVSKEDIESDNTKGRNAEDTSGSSLV